MSTVVVWLGQRRKAVVTAVGDFLIWGPLAQADHFQARDWWALALIVGHIFGVHAVANDPAPDTVLPVVLTGPKQAVEAVRLDPQPPPPVVADVGSPGD